jgi:hypothetical protein
MSHADHREVAVDDAEQDADREAPVRRPAEHQGPWSEADYRALDDEAFRGGRVELVDGALVIGPGSTAEDQAAIAHTRAALEEALPDGLCVLGPVALRMGPDCVLVPDLVVMRAPAERAEGTGDSPPDGTPDGTESGPDDGAGDGADEDAGTEQEAVIDGEEVLMVVEVVGPEHGAVDRIFKPLVYARARLPYLLLVDRHAPFASASMVISGRYHEYARAYGPDGLELEEPFRLRLPLPGR